MSIPENLNRNLDGLARLAYINGMSSVLHKLELSRSSVEEFERIWDRRNPSLSRTGLLNVTDTKEMLKLCERIEHEMIVCFREMLLRRAPGLFEEL